MSQEQYNKNHYKAEQNSAMRSQGDYNQNNAVQERERREAQEREQREYRAKQKEQTELANQLVSAAESGQIGSVNDDYSLMGIIHKYKFDVNTPALIEIKTRKKVDDTNKAGTIKKNNFFKTFALHTAIRKGHKEVVEFLLKNKADIKLIDEIDGNALSVAVKKNNLDLLKILLENSEKNLLADTNGNPIFLAISLGHKEIISHLKATYPPILVLKSSNGKTALHQIIARGYETIINQETFKTISIDLLDKDGNTLLMEAVLTNNIGMVQNILSNNPKINAQNKEGKTALHFASIHGFKNIAQILLEHKADLNIADKNGLKPLDETIKHKRIELESLLKEAENLPDAVEKNSVDNNISTLENDFVLDSILLPLRMKESLDLLNKEGSAPIHIAVKNNYKSALIRLINNKVNLNLQDINKKTALHLAAQAQHIDLLELLLKQNADPFIYDQNGNLPIHYAIENIQTIRTFCKYNKNLINATDKTGATLLHKLSLKGDFALIELLVADLNADPNIGDSGGKKPIHYANDLFENENASQLEYLNAKLIMQYYIGKGVSLSLKSPKTDEEVEKFNTQLMGQYYIEKGINISLEKPEAKEEIVVETIENPPVEIAVEAIEDRPVEILGVSEVVE